MANTNSNIARQSSEINHIKCLKWIFFSLRSTYYKVHHSAYLQRFWPVQYSQTGALQTLEPRYEILVLLSYAGPHKLLQDGFGNEKLSRDLRNQNFRLFLKIQTND